MSNKVKKIASSIIAHLSISVSDITSSDLKAGRDLVQSILLAIQEGRIEPFSKAQIKKSGKGGLLDTMRLKALELGYPKGKAFLHSRLGCICKAKVFGNIALASSYPASNQHRINADHVEALGFTKGTFEAVNNDVPEPTEEYDLSDF